VPWLDQEQYDALYGRGDVFLDSIGYGGWVTAMEAASSSTPIVTLPGTPMRGRGSAGLLRQTGVPDTIACSTEDFVSIASLLALDGGFRSQVVERMTRAARTVFPDPAVVPALENFLLRASSGVV
jgi:protein O-GlcNAc transferase